MEPPLPWPLSSDGGGEGMKLGTVNPGLACPGLQIGRPDGAWTVLADRGYSSSLIGARFLRA